jgi:hypothetical protein
MLVNPEIQRTVQPELEAGEQLLWAGQPKPSRLAFKSLGTFIFGIIWTAFCVNSAMSSINFGSVKEAGGMSGFDVFFLLFQGLFILIGLGMLASPLWVYLKAMRTYYAVTNKRILIVQAGRSRTVQSYSQGDIGDIVRTEGPDKSGDLTFAQKVYTNSDGDRHTTLIQLLVFPKCGLLRT